MKKTITLLSILSGITCFSFAQKLSANKDTLYLPNNIYLVKGQQVTLNSGSLPNGDYKYVNFWRNHSPYYGGGRIVNRSYDGEIVTIKKFKKYGKTYYANIKSDRIKKADIKVEDAIKSFEIFYK